MEGKNPIQTANIPKMIPEISFDLISRITPGAVFISCMVWLLQINILSVKIDFLFGLFLILLSYAIGFIIDSTSTYFLNKIMIDYSWEITMKAYNNDKNKLIDISKVLGFNYDEKSLEENKTIFLEKLREYVVTSFPYATWMMPKLNAEAAMPKNLAVSLIIVWFIAAYCKIINLIDIDTALFFKLLLPLLAVEFLLIYSAKHRFRRTMLRTLYWFQELQKKQNIPANVG